MPHVADLVAVHLKDICHWEGRIIEPIIDLQCGAEFSKLVVEESRAGVSHISGPDIFLCSMEITHEVITEGGWHCVYELAD